MTRDFKKEVHGRCIACFAVLTSVSSHGKVRKRACVRATKVQEKCARLKREKVGQGGIREANGGTGLGSCKEERQTTADHSVHKRQLGRQHKEPERGTHTRGSGNRHCSSVPFSASSTPPKVCNTEKSSGARTRRPNAKVKCQVKAKVTC